MRKSAARGISGGNAQPADTSTAPTDTDVPRKQYCVGQTENRPWGDWTVLDVGAGFIVKRIKVSPGQRLSLQFHYHRAEEWLCVQGAGMVEIDGETIAVTAGSHVHIPVTIPHRLTNTGDDCLCVIEVQRGQHLDESDIVRLSDDYGREP